MSALAKFDDAFAPIQPGRIPNLDAIPDGDYTMEVASVELQTTARTGEPIVRWLLKILDGPTARVPKVEWANFLRGQDQANLLGADLLILGLPTDTWIPGHPSGKRFSEELPTGLLTLVGVAFTATKSSKSSGDKTYHNLRIKGLSSDAAMPKEPLPF